MGMRILGIDPGLQVTGYGVIEIRKDFFRTRHIELVEMGLVRTEAKSGIGARLHKVYDALTDLVRELRPDCVVIEKLYAHYKHPATAILMGHVRGVVCLLSGAHKLPLSNIAATHIKKAVTGRGHANKTQIQRMVQSILGLKNPPTPVDVSDALAVAIAFAYNLKRGSKNDFTHSRAR